MSQLAAIDHRQSVHARREILRCARLMLEHPAEIHYSQGPARWEGINNHLLIDRHQFPKHGDCSSTATWMFWNALAVPFDVHDIVNGANWRAGYTGTMAAHGLHVPLDRRHLHIGDCLLYGRGPVYEHVTVYIGGGMVFSHGSEAGPFKLSMAYRSDLAVARRYIPHHGH